MANSDRVEVLRVGDAFYEKQSDGTLKPVVSKTDWKHVDSVSDTYPDETSLTDDEWAGIKLVDPFKTPVTIRLDTDVVEWFKNQGTRYQTRINAVLRQYVEAHRKAS